MVDCTFELNGQPMSTFRIGASSFPAFSGRDSHVNQRHSACVANLGPIPPGTYYILDRQAGGRLGPLMDWVRGRQDWLALYADDGRVDDYTYCNAVKRGNFRLHPKGALGVSEGCIVIASQTDFYQLRASLNCYRPQPIPGTDINAYGRVVVR